MPWSKRIATPRRVHSGYIGEELKGRLFSRFDFWYYRIGNPCSKTNSNAVIAPPPGVTAITRQIVTEQAFRANKTREPRTLWRIVRDANPRGVALHTAGVRSTRVVAALGGLLITHSHGASAAARRIFVGELTSPCAGCHLGAVVGVGHAGHVFGTRSDLEATCSARVALVLGLYTQGREESDVCPS